MGSGAVKRALALFFLISPVFTVVLGCSGCQQRLREMFTGVEPERLKGVETQSVIDSFELSDEDVRKFIRDMPVLREEFEEVAEFGTGPWNNDPFMPVLMNDSLEDRLKSLGWDPPERFFLAMNKIKEVYPYLQEDHPKMDNRVLRHNFQVILPYKEELETIFGNSVD